jgi:hypothetical protein
MPKDIVVINGKEFEVTVDGGSASGKDALLDLVNGRQGMPKDNQEINNIYLDLLAAWGETPLDKEEVLNILSTYGNAREVAKIIEQTHQATLDECVRVAEGMRLESQIEYEGVPVDTWGYPETYNRALTDLIAAITTRPGQTDMDRPLNFERE